MGGCGKIIATGWLLVVTAAGWAGAQGANDSLDALEAKLQGGPTVADLVAYAYATNPGIQAAREGWRAVVENYRVTTAYPDPQLMVTYFPEPIETRLGPQDWNATLSQMIPFPGKLTQAGELVKADAELARLELDKAVRDVVVQIREAVHELLYIRDARRVVAENQALLDHLRTVAETSFADDRAAFVDVAKAQSQTAQVRYDGLLLEELEQTERTRLNALLNRPPDAAIGPLQMAPLAPLAYPLEEIYDLAQTHQEEIRMAEARVDKATAKVDLAGYQNLPEFRLGLFYAGIGEPDVPTPPPDAGDDAVGIQAGLTIPLWWGRNQSRVAGARAEVARARALKTARINETRAQIRALYFRLHNAERLVTLYRDELLPQAARSLEVAETWFREGQGSYSDFVETEAAYYNFQLSLARARADVGKYLAKLERLVGASLTRREGEPAAPLPGEGAQ